MMNAEDQANNNQSFSLGDLPPELLKQIHQLEEPVPLYVQANYFKQSVALRALGYMDQPLQTLGDAPERVLFDAERPEEDRKMALSILGASARVEAYRIIEDFLEVAAPGILRQWALLAQLEAKVGITSDLLNERQIAVTSGLGGHEDKMRFMSLLFTNKLQQTKPFEKDLVNKEFGYRIEQAGGIIEKMKVGDNYFLTTFLIPINNPLKEIFEGIVIECNQYGDFLADSFIVTNSEVITPEEVKATLQKYADKNNIHPTH